MQPTTNGTRYCHVVLEHRMSYPDPLVVAAGEEVSVGERDARWPYVWCVNSEDKGGWVPDSYVHRDRENRGRVLQDFDTSELTVRVGERLTISKAEGGWVWCTNEQGHSGWVPEENVEGIGNGVPFYRPGDE